jgi:hypothetical protein
VTKRIFRSSPVIAAALAFASGASASQTISGTNLEIHFADSGVWNDDDDGFLAYLDGEWVEFIPRHGLAAHDRRVEPGLGDVGVRHEHRHQWGQRRSLDGRLGVRHLVGDHERGDLRRAGR